MVLATQKNCQRVLAASLRVVSAMTGNPPLLCGTEIMTKAETVSHPGDFGGNAHGATFDAKFWRPFPQ